MERFAIDARAANTRRTYRSAWNGFASFARAHAVNELPASADVVCAYLAACAESGMRASSIEVVLAAISQMHVDAGEASPRIHPLVRKVVRGIRRRLGVAPDAKDAVLPDHVNAMVAALPDTPAGIRDRAILALGVATGMRRCEISALDDRDVHCDAEVIAVSIRRCKTDPTAIGRTIVPRAEGLSPSLSELLAAWRAIRDGQGGALFTSLNRAGRPTSRRLAPAAIATITKHAASLVGLDDSRVAAHSLRAGFVTAAVAAGVPTREIMRTTGHRAVEMMDRYVRAAPRSISG